MKICRGKTMGNLSRQKGKPTTLRGRFISAAWWTVYREVNI